MCVVPAGAGLTWERARECLDKGPGKSNCFPASPPGGGGAISPGKIVAMRENFCPILANKRIDENKRRVVQSQEGSGKMCVKNTTFREFAKTFIRTTGCGRWDYIRDEDSIQFSRLPPSSSIGQMVDREPH